ncbi:MAG: hypothetical protein IT260_09555 [Saprospiraceae bacterium]|nr:hypothetical protein [Saprospiraceae bacterium]
MLFATMLLLGSCRSLKTQDFHQQAALTQPMPPLALKVHAESFLGHFAGDLAKDVLSDAAMSRRGPWMPFPSPYEVHSRVAEPMRDVFTVLGNELSDNMLQSAGEKYGQLRFKLVYYQSNTPGWGWVIPSVLTLNLANLAGMPFLRYRIDLELQMEILDRNQQVIAQYRAPGSGKSTVAMYYGYSGRDAYRKANLLALQDAMRAIRSKMEPDLTVLRDDLLAAGPEKK